MGRVFDLAFAASVGVGAAPVAAVAALGIKLSSPGPLLYRAVRAGKNGEPFEMLKFRTMHHAAPEGGSRITGQADQRVFRFGALLRALKIDELPQLINILAGDMSVVGPRPEDVSIVDDHYAAEHLETLNVRPGLSSPGSIYYYTQGESQLGDDPERDYFERLLPMKLALDTVYVRDNSLIGDLRIIVQTAWVIGNKALGRSAFSDPPEMSAARELVVAVRS